MQHTIPLVDLKAQYGKYKDEFDAVLQEVAESAAFIGGPHHRAFAQEFADYCGGGHVALCGNGTDALTLALLALLGKGNGEEILVPSLTFIATAEAVLLAGYRPVFVDSHHDTLLMDPEAAERAMTERTRAVIPVHLYGQMAPMPEIMALADRHGLKVVEDAAQAHGASYQGKGPGHWGHAACFSFYPGKNLGAWGDGGAVFSRDEHLAKQVSLLANHGRDTKYLHHTQGTNSRMDGLQAAILRVKLKHLAGWNARRRELAGLYDELLAESPAVEPVRTAPEADHVRHLYVVRVPRRDAVLEALREKGVMAGIHYPIPLHEQPVYAEFNLAPESLPVCHRACGEILSLPLYPEMEDRQAEYVAQALVQAIEETGGRS